jgi:uncharacterized protein
VTRRAVVAAAGIAGVAGLVRTVVDRRVRGHAQLPLHLLAGVGAVVAARAAGATADDLGVRPRAALRGALVGAGVGTAVGLGTLAASRSASARHHFRRRAPDDDRHRSHAFESVVRIPLNTALYEELVFRSALLGLALESLPTPAAVAVTSLLFGLWHVPHAFDPDDVVHSGSGGRVGVAAARTVVLTGAAGAAFAWLRLATGSVVAPVAAHAIVNASGYLASATA